MVKSAQTRAATKTMPPSQNIKATILKIRNLFQISPFGLTVLTIAYIFCTSNVTFWSIGVEIFAGHMISLLVFVAAIFMLTLAVFIAFAFPWTVKPFLIFMIMLSAVTSYYMDTLGVIIDRDMIQNVMVTTITESKHLLTGGFVTQIVVFGALPSAVVMFARLKRFGAIKTLAMPFIVSILSFALTAGLLMSDLKSYASVLRERKDYMSSFQPGAPIVGVIRYAKMMLRSTNIEIVAVGEDAKKGLAYGAQRKPLLTIVVAGETARSQNFSLNGYAVETNPMLSNLPVISFSDVNSCGTATATSLPCMFSKFDRASYSFEKGLSHQNVLDVLEHAGLHVEWWDNNTGDKNVAAHLTTRSFNHAEDPEFCGNGECTDGVFLQALQDYAATITQDTVLVLHQIGSHGPTYYLRYPPELERFKPACRTAEFKKCTPAEITNAYDNTIAYTDKVLAETVAFLDAQEHLSTALLYVSDHGESLGEGGLYLHGSPYFMAPEYQTKVPMIFWMSETFKNQFGIDNNCLSNKAANTLSHDNLFHSLLGMLDIETKARNPELDLFASCRGQPTTARS